MSRYSVASVALAVFMSTGAAQAATIDFTTASNDGATIVAAGATVTAGFGTTLLIGDFTANAVCPLGNSGCNGLMTLTFDQDVSGVNFFYGYGDAGDSALLSIFDSGGTLLGFYNLDSTSGVAFADLSSFGTLRSIIFDNVASTGAGYAYGDISYDPAAVPLPAALPLVLAGLGGIAALRARRAA